MGGAGERGFSKCPGQEALVGAHRELGDGGPWQGPVFVCFKCVSEKQTQTDTCHLLFPPQMPRPGPGRATSTIPASHVADREP